jgi:thymidine kinase
MFSEYTLNKKSNFDSIKVICGSMFSGKAEDLIKRIQKAKLSNFETIVFKPIIDSINHGNCISSHNKNTYEAFTVWRQQ